jgi:hypothetical protein
MAPRDDIDARIIVTTGAVIVCTVVASVLLTWGLMQLWTAHGVQIERHIATPATANPPLEPKPLEDLRHYEAEQRAKLSSYRWIDRSAGIVQIPIEQAMARVAGQPAKTSGQLPINGLERTAKPQ